MTSLNIISLAREYCLKNCCAKEQLVSSCAGCALYEFIQEVSK